MTLYDVDRLITGARQLAADYRRATGKVLPGVSGEIAEHDAARHLDLDPVKDRSAGYDALGRSGPLAQRRVLIKARTVFDDEPGNARIGQIDPEKSWDAVVLVLLDENYECCEMLVADREDLVEALAQVSEKRRRRGALSVARFRVIGRRVWTRECGLEQDEVWENHP